MMDNVFRWDLRSVLRNMREAQVISLFFPYLGRALIVDLRCDECEGPLITTDGLVSGPQERIESLRRMRPRFETPENIALSPWIGSVRTLDSSGALADITGRLQRMGRPEAEAGLQAAYDSLLAVERREIAALIRGDVEHTRTLYQR